MREATMQGTSSSSTIKKASASRVDVVPRRTVLESDIRARAYDIYLRRGCAPGDPVADWLQAESELREEYSRRLKM